MKFNVLFIQINNNTDEFKEKVYDDPLKRKPDITVPKTILNWEPKVSVVDGSQKTIDYFRNELEKHEAGFKRKFFF